MLENGRGLIKALETWAKRVTSDYKDVNVRDLSTSFRDGLAFCAIIHYYRPDLIDFDSLSRENIFENNSLAFSVAEKQLGVPALLDAEDMVKYTHPDRLSIITYLSQLRNCFENQNKVNKKVDLKRIQKSSVGPPAKLPTVEPSLRRHEVCNVCNHRVFILERLMVEGKLYHRTCFCCHKCNNILNPGAYVDSDTPGKYECSVCLIDEASDNTDSSMEVLKEPKSIEVNDSINHIQKPIVKPVKEFASKEAVSFARSNISEKNESDKFSTSYSEDLKRDEKAISEIKTSVKDKISVFERNQENENPSPPALPAVVITPVPKPRHSLILPNKNESDRSNFSNRFSVTQSLISARSHEKCDKELEKDSLPAESSPIKSLLPKTKLSSEINSINKCDKEPEKDSSPTKSLLAKSLLPKTELSSEEITSNDKPLKELNIDISEDKQDSVTSSNTSLNKVPNTLFDASSVEVRNRENSILSIKSGSESPKPSRDIFKSSLQPLKLSLLSPDRKDSTNSPLSQIELPKTFDIPQIKSIYSTSSLGRMKQTVNVKEFNSERNLSSSTDSQEEKVIRRSSLDSSKSGSKESQDKASLGINSVGFHRTNSSHELGCHADTDTTKTGLKSYTPIFKSLYSTSSITSCRLSKINVDDSVQSAIVSDVKQEIEKELSSSVIPSEVKESDKTSSPDMSKDQEVSSVPNVYQEKSMKLKEEEYPDDLNPFGDDEGDNEEDYPDDLNPFGEDEEVSEVNTSSVKISADDYDESKNPFASDDDDVEAAKDTSTYSLKPSNIENKSPYLNDSISSTLSSPSGSLKGTLKKRPAPRPPKVTDIFPKDSADSGADSSFNSTKGSPLINKKTFQASSPKLRKNKPAPPPPPSPSPSLQDPAASVKMTKETDNMKLKSSAAEDKQAPKQYKKKKRPAPPVPIPMRRDMKKIPLKEILREMKEIEEKQREYERQGREIELLIRDRDKDEEPSVEEEEYIMQLFELVNQKNALFRRQAELMYIKRSQRLEEQQYQIEREIRQLMEKPDSEKTEEDKEKEELLTLELIDIVDQRNSIIDSIEMDRRRELEEDHSVQEQLEIKNGDLPITAEIKQKSGKSKKEKKKEKKEKKKHIEEESGKSTLKKKKNLFKRS